MRKFMNEKQFRKELVALLNKHSVENGSDTPDFMLADFLVDCLVAWNRQTRQRDKWYNPDRGESLGIRHAKQRLLR